MNQLLDLLAEPTSERQFVLYEALRKGASVEELHRITHIKGWFIQQMKELVDLEEEILQYRGTELPDSLLIQAKKDGFADKYLSILLNIPEDEIRSRRIGLGLSAGWEPVPVSGVTDAALLLFNLQHYRQNPCKQSSEGYDSRRRPKPHWPGH